jgi:chromosomal replication initiator protein
MQSETRQEIWLEAAEELRDRIGGDLYDRWLKPLSILRAAEDELRLGAPNKFWQEWVEESYLREMSAALERRAGCPIRLTLGIDPHLFREMRKSQDQILAEVKEERRQELPPEVDLAKAPAKAGGPMRSCGEPQTLENFVVGASNRMAHASALQMVEQPGVLYNPFFVHGGCGLGKTHLLRGICHALRKRHPGRAVRYLTGEEFLNQFVSSLKAGTIGKFRERHRAPQVMVIDEIHLLGNKSRTQEEFLHTFNSLVDAGHQVVIASDSHPKEIGKMAETLVGRFLSGLVVMVGRPELATRLEILRRRAQRARVPFSEELLALIAERVRSNVRELLGAFNFLEENAFQDGAPLDPARALVLLAESLRIEDRRLGLSRIADTVSRRFGVPVAALASAGRSRALSLARQVAMYLARKYTDRSLAEIGKFFGDRNHAAVKSAEARVEGLRQTSPALAMDIEKIIDSFHE